MTQPEEKKDIKKSKYQDHIDALEEHKKLLAQLENQTAHPQAEQVKNSLERLAITLEEYFKVIGVP